MEAIFKRRSVREFQTKLVEDEKVNLLLKAAMQAPSAGNQRAWEFIVVTKSDKLDQLSKMSPYAKPIANAPLSIIALGNKDHMRYPENWQQDLAAATQNILLEATSLDLGAVWMSVSPSEERVNYVIDLFKFPNNLMPFCVVSIGYPLKKDSNKFIDRFEESKIHFEEY